MKPLTFKPPKGMRGGEEQWKDIVGYENLYKISSKGNIRSFVIDKYKGRKIRQTKNRPNGKAYCFVSLWKDKKGKTLPVHRLVAQAFLQQEDGRCWVNHKDNDGTNNNLENLEWCTPAENRAHAFKIGACDFNAKKIGIYDRKTGELIGVYASASAAGRDLDIPTNKHAKNSKVSAAARGIRKTAYGYKWRYLTQIECDTGLILPKHEMRLGQFLFNFTFWLQDTKQLDLFYIPDEVIMDFYKEWLNTLKK